MPSTRIPVTGVRLVEKNCPLCSGAMVSSGTVELLREAHLATRMLASANWREAVRTELFVGPAAILWPCFLHERKRMNHRRQKISPLMFSPARHAASATFAEIGVLNAVNLWSDIARRLSRDAYVVAAAPFSGPRYGIL